MKALDPAILKGPWVKWFLYVSIAGLNQWIGNPEILGTILAVLTVWKAYTSDSPKQIAKANDKATD